MDSNIQNIIFSYIEQALAGLSKENPKLDFKRKWPNLKGKPGLNEFLKDTSAMANTVGLDGFLIFGYDEKAKEFYDTSFVDSGFKDTNEITGLINRCIDRAFILNIEDFIYNNHKLSLIHIPPSFDKPHSIRNYQTFDKDGNIKKEELHRIFVRKGTTISEATKYDLDFIYYDRKNITPDYRLFISMTTAFTGFKRIDGYESFNGDIIIENAGLRPVLIAGFNFAIPLQTGLKDFPEEIFHFVSVHIFKESPLILNVNEIKKVEIDCPFSFSNLRGQTRLNDDKLSQLNYVISEFFRYNPINCELSNGQCVSAPVNFY